MNKIMDAIGKVVARRVAESTDEVLKEIKPSGRLCLFGLVAIALSVVSAHLEEKKQKGPERPRKTA